jgi:hypothetical protein
MGQRPAYQQQTPGRETASALQSRRRRTMAVESFSSQPNCLFPARCVLSFFYDSKGKVSMHGVNAKLSTEAQRSRLTMLQTMKNGIVAVVEELPCHCPRCRLSLSLLPVFVLEDYRTSDLLAAFLSSHWAARHGSWQMEGCVGQMHAAPAGKLR